MAIFKKILCAVDFSEISVRALQWAEYLAKKFHSELMIMHCISTPAMTDPFFYDSENAQLKTFEMLENFVSGLKINHDKLVCFGEPSIEIPKKAEAIKANVIVMGTAGLTGFSHRLLGSTAEYVMRHATIPVITISPLCTSPRRLEENRVLIPLADVEHAPHDTNIMKEIVDELRAEVNLMHVVSYSERMYQVKSEILPFHATTFETNETNRKLRKIGELAFGSTIITTSVDFGDVDAGILREAGSELYDFILMSAHPEQLIGLFTNSKGYNIISSAPIPVITVRTEARQIRNKETKYEDLHYSPF
jgi:nucleotide-binding universal stress UspA family protein